MVFSTLFFLYFVYGLLHCQLSSLSNILFMSLFSKRRGGGRGEEKEEEENQESSMALSPLVSHGPLSLREQLIFPLSIPRMVIPVVNPGSLPNLCLFFFFSHQDSSLVQDSGSLMCPGRLSLPNPRINPVSLNRDFPNFFLVSKSIYTLQTNCVPQGVLLMCIMSIDIYHIKILN